MTLCELFDDVPGAKTDLEALRKAAKAVDVANLAFGKDPSEKTGRALRGAVTPFLKELTAASRAPVGGSAEFKKSLSLALAACKELLAAADKRLAAAGASAAPTGDAAIWVGKMSASSKAAKVLKGSSVNWEKVLAKAATSGVKGAKGLVEVDKADKAEYRFSALVDDIDASTDQVECTLLADLTTTSDGRSLGHGLGHKAKVKGSLKPDELLEEALSATMEKLIQKAIAPKIHSDRRR